MRNHPVLTKKGYFVYIQTIQMQKIGLIVKQEALKKTTTYSSGSEHERIKDGGSHYYSHSSLSSGRPPSRSVR